MVLTLTQNPSFELISTQFVLLVCVSTEAGANGVAQDLPSAAGGETPDGLGLFTLLALDLRLELAANAGFLTLFAQREWQAVPEVFSKVFNKGIDHHG